jgi:hypothetical protein
VTPLLIINGYNQRYIGPPELRTQREPGSGDLSISDADRARLIGKLAPTIDHYCNDSKGALTRLEVWDSGVAISAAGAINVEPELIAAMDVACK